MTLGQIKSKAGKYHHARIRHHSRKLGNKYLKNLCVNCGYDKHTDVCHILSIKDAPDEMTVKEINDLKNLIRLCKNCHWELDNGYLTIGEIRK